MDYGCFGCEFHHQPKKDIQLPLIQVGYRINIVNAIAQVEIIQKYVNKQDKMLFIQYRFPNNPQSCLHKLVAIFTKKRLQGMVKQKQQGKMEYDEAIKMGKKAVFATKDSNKDVMSVEIGNIEPGQEVSIQFSYIQELTICLNTFYQFDLNILHLKQFHLIKKNKEFDFYQQKEKEVICSFQLCLKTQRKVISFKSHTHQLIVNLKNDENTSYSFALAKGQTLSNNFSFLYTTNNFELPSYALGRSDAGSSVMISLIPKFCRLNLGDAQAASFQSKLCDIQMDSVKGQYIFFLDRSGSMGGKRIKNAKKALILFIKSLPIDTFFNIISFGTNYIKLFPQSKKNSQQSISKAVSEIQLMDADLNYTQILAPFRQIFNSKLIKGYPRQFFLLTDGQISNSQQVVNLIKKNTKNTRVNTIGIGASASEQLIVDCAQNGKGVYTFIEDNQNFSEKIINILNDTLTPVVTDISLLYDKTIVSSIFPNPQNMPYILKNQAINFYITFKGQLTHPTLITFNYTDSHNNIPFKSQINISPDAESESFVEKMAYFKRIKVYQQDDREGIKQYQQFAKNTNVKDLIVKLSLRSQVLSQYTAFVCVQTELADGKYEEIKSKQIQKITIVEPTKHKNNKYKHYQDFQYSANFSQPSIPISSQSNLTGAIYDDPFNFKQQYFVANNNNWSGDVANFDCQFTSCAIQQYQDFSSLNNNNSFGDFKGFSFQSADFQPNKPQTISEKKGLETFDLLGLDNTSPKKAESQKIDIETIIKAQYFDGKWEDQQLIIKIFGESIRSIFENVLQKNVIITFLIVRWMDKYHQQPQYKLIIKKGRSWLEKQPNFIYLSQKYQQYVK